MNTKLELQHTGFNRLGRMVKTLYINGEETQYLFAASDLRETYATIGEGDYPRLYNRIKDVSCLAFPDDIEFNFYEITGKLRSRLLYGELSIVDLIKRKSFFEVGLCIRFTHKTSMNTSLNPLRLLRLCNAYAKKAGFKRTEVSSNIKDEWFDMFSGEFFYRSRNNTQTAEQKLEEAITAFNSLLNKAAAEMLKEIKKELERA